MSGESVLVTGATGNVGAEVVAQLAGRGAAVKAGVRDPERNLAGIPSSVSTVRFDFLDHSTYSGALAGVGQVFLMRPPPITNIKRDMAPFIDAIAAAGVRHVVFLSLQGADRNRFVPHRRIEERLAASGIPSTFLRPSFFMQNLSTTHRDEIRLRDEIFVPAGGGRTSFVDVRDVAAVAALALSGAVVHQNAAYELTSRDSLTYHEVAGMLSDELGRRITYRSPAIPVFMARKLRERHPLDYILVVTALYTVARLGKAARTTGEMETLLGRPAISMRQFVRDHRAVWQP